MTWRAYVILIVGLILATGLAVVDRSCQGQKSSGDTTQARHFILQCRIMEVYYLGDKGGAEDDQLISTLTSADARFGVIRYMLLTAIESGKHPRPKAPRLSEDVGFILKTADSKICTVILRLDSIDIDGIFYYFDKQGAILSLFDGEIRGIWRHKLGTCPSASTGPEDTKGGLPHGG